MSESRKELVSDSSKTSLLDLRANPNVLKECVPAQAGTPSETLQIMSRLSQTCKTLHGFFKPRLDRLKFFQAVIDDNRDTVTNMLNASPQLLLTLASKNLTIESRHTWQRFAIGGESALTIAVKRRQIEMIKLLAPYHDKLSAICETEEEKQLILNTKVQALSTWAEYETAKNAQGYQEFVIPPMYADIIQNLITTFSQETFPEGKGQLSQKTEDAVTRLFDMLLSEQAVRLADYFDVELLFYAVCKMYDEKFDLFQNWPQRDAFCIRVMGLIQGVLSPETAKILCEGLYYVVNENKPVGDLARALKMKGGQSFYRASRDSRSGTAFEYLCGGLGGGSRVRPVVRAPSAVAARWKTYIEQKHRAYKPYAATKTDPGRPDVSVRNLLK